MKKSLAIEHGKEGRRLGCRVMFTLPGGTFLHLTSISRLEEPVSAGLPLAALAGALFFSGRAPPARSVRHPPIH